MVVRGRDGLEQGLRLLSALEEIAEWILAPATTVLGTRALAVVLFGGGDGLGVVGALLVELGVAAAETGGEGDDERAGGDEGDKEVVGQPVGHHHQGECKSSSRVLSTSDHDKDLCKYF